MSDPAARRRVLKIIASRDGDVVWSGERPQGEITIGRSPSSDVVLDDPMVSWTHARVVFGKEGIAFLDCSTNGSFRNGDRITQVNLGPGGVIAIPPFEVDLVIETVADSDHRSAFSGSRAATTVSEPLSAGIEDINSRVVGQTGTETLTLSDAPSHFDPSVIVINVIGRIDGYTAEDLKDAIDRAIASGHCRLIANLSKCQYCDHSGFAALLNAQVTLTAKKGGLRLIGLNPQLHDAVRLLRLDDVLLLAADERTAAGELSARPLRS
jgi:anti-anti-sigma factor